MIKYERKKETTSSILTIVYTFKIKKKELPALYLLPLLLKNRGDSYKSNKEFTRLLFASFGSTLEISSVCSGKLTKFFVIINVPKQEYVDEDNFFKILSLSHELIFSSSDRFKEEDLEDYKKEYVKLIKDLEDNSDYIAKYRALQQLDKNDARNFPPYISLNALKKVTIDDIKNVHQKLIKSHLSFYYQGDMSKKEISEMTKKLFSNPTRTLHNNSHNIMVMSEISGTLRKENKTQSAIAMVYAFENGEYVNSKVFNIILSRLLFKEIREKKGYCYYINSSVDYSRGLIMISALMPNNLVDSGIQEIRDVVDSFKISSSDVDFASKKLINDIKTLDDNFLSKSIFLEMRAMNKETQNIKSIIKKCQEVKPRELNSIKDTLHLVSTYSVIGGVENEK